MPGHRPKSRERLTAITDKSGKGALIVAPRPRERPAVPQYLLAETTDGNDARNAITDRDQQGWRHAVATQKAPA
jgi:hypothetical protein